MNERIISLPFHDGVSDAGDITRIRIVGILVADMRVKEFWNGDALVDKLEEDAVFLTCLFIVYVDAQNKTLV
jgi:hypothetical protein